MFRKSKFHYGDNHPVSGDVQSAPETDQQTTPSPLVPDPLVDSLRTQSITCEHASTH